VATQSPPQSIPTPALSRGDFSEPLPVNPGASPAHLVASIPARGAEAGLDDEGNGGSNAGALRLSSPMERLPVGLAVSVPVREFRIRNLLAMTAGALIETQWGHGEDLPLSSGDVQLAWSEFEVVDTRLAVRVTRLA